MPKRQDKYNPGIEQEVLREKKYKKEQRRGINAKKREKITW